MFMGSAVVAQLVQQTLPTPEVRGSKQIIGKFCAKVI